MVFKDESTCMQMCTCNLSKAESGQSELFNANYHNDGIIGCVYTPISLFLSLHIFVSTPPTMFVPLNFLALVSLRKSASISANVLSFVSGSRHQLHTNPAIDVPAQKNPALGPQSHAVGFNILGVITFVMMPEIL